MKMDNTERDAAKQARDSLIASLGLEYNAVFVPQSASRNSQEKNPSLNWRVSIIRRGADNGHGRVVGKGAAIATDYMQGIAHVPTYNKMPRGHMGNLTTWKQGCERAAETGKYPGRTSWQFLPLPAPPIADILYSLLMDGDAADETFDDWCSNYGYDTDSRSAEATYNACRDTGRQLQRMFTRAELSALREAFQDY
jgi:hypothetical protein